MKRIFQFYNLVVLLILCLFTVQSFSQVHNNFKYNTSDTDFYKSNPLNELFPADWNINVTRNPDLSVYDRKPAEPGRVIDTILAARLQFLIDSVRLASNNEIKGISAAVYIPWQGTWLGTTGISHAQYNITPGMKFGIASNTKTFIASLILKLAEMNMLSLDDSLHKWLPHFQYVDSTITIRQLLNHTSGVYNFINHPNWWPSVWGDLNRLWTPEETMVYMHPPYFPPGQGWMYSNTNYLLAGMIIRNITDTLVSYKLRQLILNPVNLNNTYFDVEENIPDTVAGGWLNGVFFGELPRTSMYSSVWTAGAMFSTGENMVRWYYNLFTGQVLNQSSMNQMLNFVPGFDSGYGLGVMRHSESGHTFFYHTGSWCGYVSYCVFDSATKICVAALINTYPANPITVGNVLLNAIFGHITGINKNYENIPAAFHLQQNYPNPFNPVTKIKFDIPLLRGQNGGIVTLKVYDILGKVVATLVNKKLQPGSYELTFDGNNLPSGAYFYKLSAGDFSGTKRMILIK